MDIRDDALLVRGLLALALFAVLAAPALAGGGSIPADYGTQDLTGYYYVWVLDPTFVSPGGIAPDVAWLTDLVTDLGNNPIRPGDYHFGLVVPDAQTGTWTQHTFGSTGFKYGSAEDLADAIESYAVPTDAPEGVDGLLGVLEALTYPWTKIITLVSDGPWVDEGGNFGNARDGARAAGEKVNAIVDHGLRDGSGEVATGVYWGAFPPVPSHVRAYLPVPDGYGNEYTRSPGGGAPPGLGDPTVRDMYAMLSKDTRGSAWDLNFSDGSPFRRGFVDVKVEELGGFGGGGFSIPEPSTGALVLVAGGLLAVLGRRRRRG